MDFECAGLSEEQMKCVIIAADNYRTNTNITHFTTMHMASSLHGFVCSSFCLLRSFSSTFLIPFFLSFYLFLSCSISFWPFLAFPAFSRFFSFLRIFSIFQFFFQIFSLFLVFLAFSRLFPYFFAFFHFFTPFLAPQPPWLHSQIFFQSVKKTTVLF